MSFRHLVAAAGLVLSIAGISACGARHQKSDSYKEPSRSALRLALRDDWFPQDAYEDRLGIGFENFLGQLIFHRETACLRRAGEPPAPPPVPLRGVDPVFPPVSLLAQADESGFLTGYQMPVNPAARLGPKAQVRYRLELGSCQHAVLRPLAQVLSEPKLVRLTHQWRAKLASLSKVAVVIRAEDQAGACARQQGYNVPPGNRQSEVSFFAKLQATDTSLAAAGREMMARRYDQRAIKIFVRCFAYVEHTRDRLQKIAWTAFLRRRRLAVDVALDRAVAVVFQEGRGYKLRLELSAL